MSKLHLIGNAHLDAAWIWPWQEGYGEIKATFLSALQRLDEYDEFLFTSSSAQYYEWIEQSEPELFARIREKVAQGRWVICGGWWIQPDCNLPCGESFVRQALLGQHYFLEKLGAIATVGYNVDSFGHNGALPQLLRKSGLDAYVFLRPGPHELELPGRVFRWESQDGSSVLAYRIPINYSCNLDLQEHLGACLSFLMEEGPQEHLMCFYGVGNHGGGPTRDNIEYLQKEMRAHQDIDLQFSSPNRFFEELRDSGAPLPRYQGDLLHHAPGCYSAHSQIKQQNRRAENQLLKAERYLVLSQLLGRPPCPIDLNQAWKRTLFNQFHDILAGSSIPEVYEAAAAQYGEAIALAEDAENHALQSISFHVDIPFQDQTQPLVVFNPLPWPVTALVCHEKGSWGNPGFPAPCQVLDSSLRRCPHQLLQTKAQLDDRQQLAFLAALPAFGYETFAITPDHAPAQAVPAPSSSELVLENELVRIRFSEAWGYPVSFYDKAQKAELLDGPACAPIVFADDSDTWGHEQQRFCRNPERFALKELQKTEEGPVLSRMRVTGVYGTSRLTQIFTLLHNSATLFVEARLCWQEPHKCLKLEVPLKLDASAATYEIPFGHSVRENDGRENPMQSWMDVSGLLTESGLPYGMGLLSDGKSAVSVESACIRMTVLRSPAYAHHAPYELAPDVERYQYLDQGAQSFQYALVPHTGGWQSARIAQKAMELNLSPTKVVETFHSGHLPRRLEGVAVDKENIIVTAVKHGYKREGILLRAYELSGQSTNALLSLPLLPCEIAAAFTPYEIKTYLIDPKDGTVTETNLIELD